MHIEYSISLWNFIHYASNGPGLERVLAQIREQGFGVELWCPYAYGTHIWRPWPAEEALFVEPGHERLRKMLQGMTVSLHSAGVSGLAEHRRQIDTAAELGARVLVVHPAELAQRPGNDRPDLALCREVVRYAAERGVRVALENGQLPFLIEVIENVDDLNICLDVGHVYLTGEPMPAFLNALKDRIIHLHLQDLASAVEEALPLPAPDHYIPGSGSIPPEDWQLLAATLHEIDYHGIAVFEIQPRNPYQTAVLARQFVAGLW